MTATAVRERLDLPIEGMTCASCVARVERALNALDGVEATVNLATETASVDFDPELAGPEQLAAAVERSGYRARPEASAAAEHDHADPSLTARLRFAAALSVPVVALSIFEGIQFDGWEVLALALAAPVVLWAGLPFHLVALSSARHGRANMDTLISLGTLSALAWSAVVVVAGLDEHVYLEVGAVVTTALLTGRMLEARAKRHAGAALRALLELGAKEASVLGPDGTERRVAIEDLAVGDRFVVRPGEKVATDGVVEDGASAIDRSLVTGENVPVEVGPGDPVTGATVNAGGRLVVRAAAVGADTQLARIGRLVTEAQSGKSASQRLADRVSAVFVPVVIVLALATGAAWMALGEPVADAFIAAVAVLIIACPCALGLAMPTALLVGTGRGAQLGILIRGPEALERARRMDTILLDKTGTVTTGEMRMQDVVAASAVERADALRLAGALEDASEHPIGRAIAAAARAELGELPPVRAFRAHAGLGVEGEVEGRTAIAGSARLLGRHGIDLPSKLEQDRARIEQSGSTAVALAVDGRAIAMIGVGDVVKPTSAGAVARLRELGLRPVLLTGDNARTARAVAEAVGIDEVVAEVLPEGKAEVVARMRDEGAAVAVVGDGVNDAPALAAADLGVAVGTGADVAIEAADLTLVSGDLALAPDAIRLARRTLRTIRQNLFWAFAYNVAALPLAAAGLLSPAIAGAAMALSSVFVVANSLRLRRFRAAAATAGL